MSAVVLCHQTYTFYNKMNSTIITCTIILQPSPVNVSDEATEFGVTASNLTRRMVYLNTVLQNFWKRWKTEYLTGLREIHSSEKGIKDTVAGIQVGDVFIHDPVQPRALWKVEKL